MNGIALVYPHVIHSEISIAPSLFLFYECSFFTQVLSLFRIYYILLYFTSSCMFIVLYNTSFSFFCVLSTYFDSLFGSPS